MSHNFAFVRSDESETEIKATAAFATSYAFSDELDTRDFALVDIWVTVTDKGTSTTMSIKGQDTAVSGTPVTADWADVVSDNDITSAGVTTGPAYVQTITMSDFTAPFRRRLRFPAGTKMRFGVQGTVADGAFTIEAVRKVGG